MVTIITHPLTILAFLIINGYLFICSHNKKKYKLTIACAFMAGYLTLLFLFSFVDCE